MPAPSRFAHGFQEFGSLILWRNDTSLRLNTGSITPDIVTNHYNLPLKVVYEGWSYAIVVFRKDRDWGIIDLCGLGWSGFCIL